MEIALFRRYFSKKMRPACTLPETDEHLEAIEKLLPKLKNLPVHPYSTVAPARGRASYTVKTVEGEDVHVKEIYSNGVVWADMSFLKKGTLLPAHYHPELQIVVCIKGAGEIVMCPDDQPQTVYRLLPGRMVYTKPDIPHTVRTIEDTQLLVAHVRVPE